MTLAALALWPWWLFAVLIIAMVCAGLAAGFIGGLLGVGGGIVMVPVLHEILIRMDVSETSAMHLAVGTSLAVIIGNSLRSVSAHAGRGAVDFLLLRRFALAIFLGAAAGAIIAAFVSAGTLKAIFAYVCLVFAIYMAFAPFSWVVARNVPSGAPAQGIAALIGGLSAMMGIGGGTFGTTAMTLYGVPIHRAVATGAGIGVLIGLPATAAFLAAGWYAPGLPPVSAGFVWLGALIILMPAAIVSAPWGARAAHGLPQRGLRVAFAVFLAAAGLRMLMT